MKGYSITTAYFTKAESFYDGILYEYNAAMNKGKRLSKTAILFIPFTFALFTGLVTAAIIEEHFGRSRNRDSHNSEVHAMDSLP